MVIVLSTPLAKMLKKTALSVPNVYEIKTVKQNVFLYVDNDQTQAENIALIKNAIKKKHGDDFVYKVYGVFNGKVDLSQNKTDEEKMKDDYFTLGKKDITDEEVAEFKAKNNL
ncbi:MAG TPA: hypothetical protein DCP49_07835 [Erysipelotrichaceae bacterium]|nr:hypothetical protein [Erysipelotrichaceae bacterium]